MQNKSITHVFYDSLVEKTSCWNTAVFPELFLLLSTIYKVTQLPDYVILQSHATNRNHYIFTTRVPLATKLDRMVAHLDGLLSIKFHYPLLPWSCDITWQADYYISTITVPLTTKLGRMVTYLEGLLTIKLHEAWTCGLARSCDKQKSLCLRLPMATKPGRMVAYLDWLLSTKSHDFSFSSRDLMRSCDKIEPLYLHYHIAYGHRTWEDGTFPWMVPNYKLTQRSVHVVLQIHVTKKIIISLLSQCLWPPNLVEWWHSLRDS